MANEKNVSLVFCDKIQVTFDSTNPNGCVFLSSLKWATELDFDIRSEYNKAHVAKRRDLIDRNGSYVIENGENAGERCTYIGNPKAEDMSEAQKQALAATQEAAAQANQDAALNWRCNSKAYKRALDKAKQGWSVTQIANDLSDLYDIDPENYGTPKGCKPSKGTVSKWLSETSK